MDPRPPPLPPTPPAIPTYAAPPPSNPYGALRLLSVFYWVWSALLLLGVGFIVLMLGVGYHAESKTGFDDPGGIAAFVIFGVMLAVLLPQVVISVMAAMALPTGRRRLLCQIAAGAACLWGLPGIGLGVWTFVVLHRPDIKALTIPAPAPY